MLITRAALLGGEIVDIRLSAIITEVADKITPRYGEEVYDARGALVIPGLHDHHVHLRAAAAAERSVPAGPPWVRTDADLRRELHDAAVGSDGWIRATGYHNSVAGELDARTLDRLSPPVPVRVQHRSGALWILNTVALQRIGATGDGRFFRTDPVEPPPLPPVLRALSDRLVAMGVTGVTDATPGYTDTDIDVFSDARRSGELVPRLHCMAVAGSHPTAEVTIGPAKRILDDTNLDLAELTAWVGDNHHALQPVAVHTVTDAQLVLATAALQTTGCLPGDRIEHAAVVPDDCIGDLADLGVTVVTQPNFVAERGTEYLADVPAAQHDRLWRVASLQSAGIPVALSTDTPFGDADPWAAMRAAVARRTTSGVVLGVNERIAPEVALAGFLGRADAPGTPRRVAIGEPGDLCILSGPAGEVLASLDAGLVAATIIGGRQVYG